MLENRKIDFFLPSRPSNILHHTRWIFQLYSTHVKRLTIFDKYLEIGQETRCVFVKETVFSFWLSARKRILHNLFEPFGICGSVEPIQPKSPNVFMCVKCL